MTRLLLSVKMKLLPLLTALLVLFGLGLPARATHLVGGEARARFLDNAGTTPGRPYRYEITFSIYANCNTTPAPNDPPSSWPCGKPLIGVAIYDRGTGAQLTDPDNPVGTGVTDPCSGNFVQVEAGLFVFDLISNPVITTAPPAGCNITAGCARIATYTRIVDMPLNISGFYALYGDQARNNSVKNLSNAGNQPQVLVAELSSPIIRVNANPVFTDTTVVLLCASTTDTTTLINNAFDAEGDRLTYRFYTPYNGPFNFGGGAPYPTVFTAASLTTTPYAGGYSLTQPFGAGGVATINQLTGETKYLVPTTGDYVVGIAVDEHRTDANGNDIVISTTVREVQLKVRQCVNAPSPSLVFSTGTGTSITIEEGQTATFSATGSVVTGNPLSLAATSPLLDGPGGFTATFNGQVGTAANQPIRITGITTLTGNFSYTSVCGSAGVYNVNLSARDVAGCPIKTTSIPYVITVRKPAAPNRVNGDSVVCPNTVKQYTAVGAPATTQNYQWTVAGGTIQGSATGATVSVNWAIPGTGTLTVIARSALGCLSLPITRSVEITPSLTAAFSGLQAAYCLNPTAPGATLTGAPAGGTFTITGAGGTTNLVGNVFTPRVAGTFQVLYSVSNALGCNATSTAFSVTVNALPTVVLAPSLPATVCKNASAITLSGTVNGAATTTGFTIDGVAATSFNPALLTVGAHVVALTGTGVGNCQSTATRTVTVQAVPVVALTGLQTTYCRNAPAVTLTATANGAPLPAPNAVFTVNGAVATRFSPATLAVGFYTVRVTGTSAGCTSSDSLRVEVRALPTLALTGLLPAYCRNAPPVTLAGTVNGAAGGTFRVDGIPATVFNPATLALGPHVVRFVGNAGGCADSLSQTVTINALPTVAITAPTATSFCQGDLPITLTGTLNGTATTAPALTFTLNGQPATVLDPRTLAPGTYTLVAAGTLALTGCQNTLSQTITIRPLPVVDILNLQPTYCASAAPVPLTGTVNGAPVTSAFTIDGTPATVLNPATLTPGSHRVVLTATGANGCLNRDTAFVTINALPVVAITGLLPAYCVGQPAVTLAGTVTGGTAANLTFTVNGTVATTLNPGTLAPGTYTVIATGTNPATTCQSTATQTVTINALPTVAITGLLPAYCVGQPAVTLAGTVTGGTAANLTFTVNGTVATTLNPGTLAPGTYTVIATGTNPATTCQSTATQTVTINALPTVAITGLLPAYCVGQPAVTLAGTVNGTTGNGPVTFTVNGTAATSFDPATRAPGTYTVVATGTLTATGCQNTTTQTVTINALPVVAITGLLPVYCVGQPAVTLAGTVNGTTGNGPVTFTVNGTAATSFDPATRAPGTYTVVATGTLTATGCQNTTTQTVTINALPVVAITGLLPAYCVGQPAVTLAGTVTGGTAANLTFTVNGTVATTLNPGTLAPGTYTVIATGTNPATTCQSTATQTVTINALPTVAITGLLPAYCVGQPAVTLAGTVTGGTAANLTFTVNGTVATTLNPGTLAPGTYTVIATGTNPATTCQSTATQTVNINALPTVAITGLNATYCASAPAVTLTGTLNGSPTTGTTAFTINGAAATTFNPAILGAGTYTVVATGTLTATGCQSTATQTVTINALPPVAITAPAGGTTLCEGASITLTATGATSYVWSNGISTVTGPTLTISPTATVQYVLTGTDGVNCLNRDTVTITVNPRPVADSLQGPPSVCPGLTGVPYAVQTPRPAVVTYQWTVTGGTIASGQGSGAITVDWGAANPTASIQLVTVNTATGCESLPVLFPVRINQLLQTQTPTGPASICVNANGGQQTFQIPTPTPGSSYNWALTGSATGTISGQNTPTITVTFTQPGTATLIVTETSVTPLANCFGTSAPLTVTVRPAPTALLGISGDTTLCSGNTNLALQATGGSAGSTFAWLLDSTPLPATGSTLNVPQPAPGTYTLTIQETNPVGCAGPVTRRTVVVSPTPTALNVTGVSAVCADAGPQTFQVTNAGGGTLTWKLNTAVLPGVTGSTLTLPTPAPGTYTLTASETSVAGCVGPETSLTLVVNPTPSATLAIQGDTVVCASAATLGFSLNGDPTSAYAWTFNGGGNTAPGLTTFNVAVPTAPGTYELVVTETNTFGCAGPAYRRQVVVNPTPGVLTFSDPGPICAETPATLVAVGNGLPGSVFQWTVANGTIVTGQGTPVISVEFDPSNLPNSVVLTVTETSALGCLGTPQQTTLRFDVTTARPRSAGTALTDVSRLELAYSASTSGAVPGQVISVRRRDYGSTGFFAEVGTTTLADGTFVDASATPDLLAYEYQLVVATGCRSFRTSEVIGTTRLTATGGGTETNVALAWNQYIGPLPFSRYEVLRRREDATTYEVVTTIADPATTTYSARLGADGFKQAFRVRVVMSDGAEVESYSNEANLVFDNKLNITNIITPDGDNLNDRLVIDNLALYPNAELAIFSRWGREVYRKANYDNSFDAADVPAGTYYYQLVTRDGKTLKGWLEIVR